MIKSVVVDGGFVDETVADRLSEMLIHLQEGLGHKVISVHETKSRYDSQAFIILYEENGGENNEREIEEP